MERVRSLVRNALPERDVIGVELLSGGNRNSNLLVELRHAAPIVLRIYRSGEAGTARREAALLRLLADVVPVPRVLHVDASETLELPFVMMERVEGVRLEHRLSGGDDDAELGANVGGVLARIHAIQLPVAGWFDPELQTITPFGESDGWFAFIRKTLDEGQAAQRLGRDVAARLRTLLDRHPHALDGFVDAPCLLHADFKPANLLIRVERPAVAAVLDWEFAFSGPALFDLAIMLRHEEEMPPRYVSAMLESYQSERGPLPEGWRTAARLLDLVNLCDLANRPYDAPRMYADIRCVVASSLQQLERAALLR